jgi:tetratricopeptide (TPR) repeat protein
LCGFDDEVSDVTDDRHDERPERPSWAVVPTMPWSQVQRSDARDSGTATSGARQRENQTDEDDLEEHRLRFDTARTGEYRPRRAAPDDEAEGHRDVLDEDDARGDVSPAVPTSPAVSPSTEPAIDPEHALANAKIDYDPTTLYEIPENIYELYRIRDALTTKIDAATDNAGRARLLGLRAVVGRMIGDLRPALSDAKMALVHAEATGQLRRVAVAQARLANVLVRLGELDEADRLFTRANSPELTDRLRATIHHCAGRCAFEQNRYIEACQHFEKALELRRDGDPELIAATEVALDALFSRVAERGWGPYPRTRDEILQAHLSPVPTFAENVDRWGYRGADGGWPVRPQFADVQPFRDGVAWVRPVGIETWGLIDEVGRLLIDPRAGFLGVGSFSDGLAWVSRNGLSGWVAIDKVGRVVIPGHRDQHGRGGEAGFDDVRPFRRGIAIVRRGGKWGAIERGGRLAVQFAFDAFVTGLADGRYVDGFTDEGLAIVEVGGRKGIIDRTGRVLVPLAYPTIVIHPLGFLFTDAKHRWGAIARSGAPLISPAHASRKAASDELDALLVDTRPML